MPSLANAFCLLLLGVLCADLATAGSSFLSPGHQQRKEPKKPPAKVQPRALEGWVRPEHGDQASEGLEMQPSTPFDVGPQLSATQYQQLGQALYRLLQHIALWDEAREAPADE